MAAERHHGGLLVDCQNRRVSLLRTHGGIMDIAALTPLLDYRRTDTNGVGL